VGATACVGSFVAWILWCWHADDSLAVDVVADGSLRSAASFCVALLPYGCAVLGVGSDVVGLAVGVSLAVLPEGSNPELWEVVVAVASAAAAAWPLWWFAACSVAVYSVPTWAPHLVVLAVYYCLLWPCASVVGVLCGAVGGALCTVVVCVWAAAVMPRLVPDSTWNSGVR
jgi:hypothetical protein